MVAMPCIGGTVALTLSRYKRQFIENYHGSAVMSY